MPTSSVQDITNIVIAGCGIATVLGGAIAFVGARVEVANRRLAKCEDDRTLGRERRAILITIIEFLTNALSRHDPTAPELQQAKHAITELRVREDEAAKK